MKNRRTLIAVGVLVSFALLILSISMFYIFQHDEMEDSRLQIEDIDGMSSEELKDFISSRRESEPTVKGFYLIPFMAFIGVLVGTLVYYIMADKIETKEKSLQKNSRIILKFLTSAEKSVVHKLLENEGKVQQYELSHLPNLNKVKTHRILQNLEQKGIIHKEKLGKINKIVLNKELYDVLRD